MDGPWDIKRVIGTVPVKEDGSVKFFVPANTPISIQPLDEQVYNRRCVSCHDKLEGTTSWNGHYAWINFTRAKLSPALTAHLSKPAGGRGIDKTISNQAVPLFADTTDAAYQIMLEAIETGRQLTMETPAADMKGFQNARPEP